jgi:hypothetical protein
LDDGCPRSGCLAPARYRRRTVYTDGYGAYGALLAPWQHRLCQRYEGGTCTGDGVNNSLRHRCSFLVRRHSGFVGARDCVSVWRFPSPLTTGPVKNAGTRIRPKQRTQENNQNNRRRRVHTRLPRRRGCRCPCLCYHSFRFAAETR